MIKKTLLGILTAASMYACADKPANGINHPLVQDTNITEDVYSPPNNSVEDVISPFDSKNDIVNDTYTIKDVVEDLAETQDTTIDNDSNTVNKYTIENGCKYETATGKIDYPDSNLEKAIREKIGKEDMEEFPYLTINDVNEINSAELIAYDIKILEGIQCLYNLNDLSLRQNNISDISPLSNLTNLKGLGLEDNNISDISPLSNLTNLEWLNLWDNNISDISPLSNLTNLEYLYSGSNEISDISSLFNLTNL